MKTFRNEYRLSLNILQKQKRPLFNLTVPVAVWVEGSNHTCISKNLTLDSKTRSKVTACLLQGQTTGQSLLDPYTDLFRKLDPREAPTSIGQSYGAPAAAAVFPQAKGKPVAQSLRAIRSKTEEAL